MKESDRYLIYEKIISPYEMLDADEFFNSIDSYLNSNFKDLESIFEEITLGHQKGLESLFSELNDLDSPLEQGLVIPELESYDNQSRSTKENAEVLYVSPEYLPSGDGWKALGMYVPSTHTIYIANNLPEPVEDFVYHHEIAHSLGVVDENLADDYAASKTGYYLAA